MNVTSRQTNLAKVCKMENSKLVQLLKTFSTQELREFKDFMQSPLFNKNQDLVDFYLYLKKIAPNFPTKKLVTTQVL
ncbi:MAG: hypothetical protein ACI9XO_003786 [Paraglaciecola sp.]